MSKIIVTHFRPDLDACAGVWLVKKYMLEFKDANVAFVSAGHTYENQIADTDKNIIHVDTGRGMFDHHHLQERLSAAKRLVSYLIEKDLVPSHDREALLRFAEVITMVDNFEESTLAHPEADFYDLALHQIIAGYEYLQSDDNAVITFASDALEAFFTVLKHKVLAEKELQKGTVFHMGEFKGIGIETRNEEAMHLAQKTGYDLVIRKDPKTGRGRIKVRPVSKLTLERVYEELGQLEDKNQWFYHASGKMLLNGSTRNQTLTPTRLTLSQLIEIVKKALS